MNILLRISYFAILYSLLLVVHARSDTLPKEETPTFSPYPGPNLALDPNPCRTSRATMAANHLTN